MTTMATVRAETRSVPGWTKPSREQIRGFPGELMLAHDLVGCSPEPFLREATLPRAAGRPTASFSKGARLIMVADAAGGDLAARPPPPPSKPGASGPASRTAPIPTAASSPLTPQWSARRVGPGALRSQSSHAPRWKGSIAPVPMEGGTGLLITEREIGPAEKRQMPEGPEARTRKLPETSPVSSGRSKWQNASTMGVARVFEKALTAESEEDLGLPDDRRRGNAEQIRLHRRDRLDDGKTRPHRHQRPGLGRLPDGGRGRAWQEEWSPPG